VIGPAIQTMIVAFAYFKVAACFKLVERIREWFHIITCSAFFIMLVWGWIAWAVTSDFGCYSGQMPKSHYINPRTLVLLWVCCLTIGFVSSGVLACVLVWQHLPPEDDEPLPT